MKKYSKEKKKIENPELSSKEIKELLKLTDEEFLEEPPPISGLIFWVVILISEFYFRSVFLQLFQLFA